jgi:transcription antitermination factor NusG
LVGPPIAAGAGDASAALLAPGAAVAIAEGPFRGFTGLYAGMTAHERELVLINLLGHKRRLRSPPAS